ncbi:prenyltransferase/squalene oxidase repeat-containing protein [Clostridium lundense]|uniref:prenyltransferase/squalene oxidase repeat-containing protein n=1 Tax=Clostridium lundense TaxID=319475 RepID=UPI000689060E|nr:prenyltransferase/squalene oxidase repeat-containing protein [Clostridium lundense]
MLKKSKFKKIISTSIMTLMLAGTIDSGIIGMRQIYVHAATIEATQSYQSLRMPVSTSVIDAAVERTSKAVMNHHYSNDWAAIGLDRAGKGKEINKLSENKNYLQDVVTYLQDKNNKDLFESRPTEYERITLGVLAAGGDPTNVNGSGINLIEKICNADLNSQGINALVFGLIALDAADYSSGKYSVKYEVPKKKKMQIIKGILDQQLTDGGWAFGGSKGDPDMTGMAMTALAPYSKSNKKVKQAVDNAVNCLSELQIKDGENAGGFKSWGTVNSESCAQAIMGLCTNGIDAGKDKRFVKNGRSVVDALLSFEVGGAGFAHINDERFGGVNGMATEQALYALDEYKLFLSEKDENGNLKNERPSIYDWKTYESSAK